MKKFMPKMLALLSVAVFLVSLTGIAAAAMTSGSSVSSKAVGKLKAEISMLNSDANLPQGDKIIMKQLTDNFRVGTDKVSSLLSRNMQYGDVAATLAFADKMPGGVTDANLNKVVNMRDRGWDELAKNLNVSISTVASKLSSIEDTAHKNIKQAYADSLASGSAAGGMGGGTGESTPGEATGGTGTVGETPGGMYGTGNGSYGSGGISGGGAGGTEGGTSDSGLGSMDSGTSGGGAGGMSGGSSSSSGGGNY